MSVTELGLSAEEIKVFERFYQKRIQESGGARDDATELEYARDILDAVVKGGLTPMADGGVSNVRRGAMDWTDTDTMRAVQSVTGGDEANKSPAATSKNGAGGRIGFMGILQGVGVAAMLVIALGWFFWPSGGDEANPEALAVLPLDEGLLNPGVEVK